MRREQWGDCWHPCLTKKQPSGWYWDNNSDVVTTTSEVWEVQWYRCTIVRSVNNAFNIDVNSDRLNARYPQNCFRHSMKIASVLLVGGLWYDKAPINFHRLWADHFSNATRAIFCRALAAWILNPNHVSFFILPSSHLWFRERVIFNTFYSDMIFMQHISLHGARGNVILWGDVVPIDRLQYWTILSRCDSLNSPMTSSYNSVSTRWVGTPKPQMHVLIPRKFSKVFTSECSVVVGQNFHQWASLEENILQLLDNSGHILSAQWLPYCKSRGATVDDRKFSPLWWVMSIANLFQLFFTPSFPFFQRTEAWSIDRQVSQAFTTELAVSLDTCGSTNLAKYKVCFAPGCPLWWWMSATWSLSSYLPTIAQLLSTGSLPSLSKSIHLHGTGETICVVLTKLHEFHVDGQSIFFRQWSQGS